MVTDWAEIGGRPYCCRATTGGSFAKTSRSMARKSRIFDFFRAIRTGSPASNYPMIALTSQYCAQATR